MAQLIAGNIDIAVQKAVSDRRVLELFPFLQAARPGPGGMRGFFLRPIRLRARVILKTSF